MVQMDILGDPAAVSDALAGISTRLCRAGLTADDVENARIVLAEVMNNIVEHAYADNTPGRILVGIAISGNSLQCAIKDTGRALPNESIPPGNPTVLDGPLEDLPEGGFGWFLIHSLTTDLQYRRTLQQNHLSFSIRLGAAP